VGQKVAVSSLALACFVLGVAPGLLFGILPLSGEWTSHPFTVSHIAEGIVLAVLGVVGFYVARGAINRIGVAPDIDALYNPAVFYGTRVTARATTRGYALVDSGAVSLARVSAWAVNEPRDAVERALPRGARGWYDKRVTSTPGETGLRVGIGETILVISLVLSAVLFVVLL
jgi:multicomponent Na+:H+ antiporter subunit D